MVPRMVDRSSGDTRIASLSSPGIDAWVDRSVCAIRHALKANVGSQSPIAKSGHPLFNRIESESRRYNARA